MPTKLISVAPGGSRLQTPDGKPFFAVIVNYVGHSDRAWAQFMPGQFDAALIEADFRLARQTGANTIRTFVASPLQNEFPKGDWSKLDALVWAAERAGVYLLLTLADYGPSYLQTMAAHAGMIAARYKGNPIILGYDLRNEPHFYNLAILHYPQPLPLFAANLATIYPPRADPGQALFWARSEGAVPTWVSDADAIRYANAYEVWSDFLAASSAWAAERNMSATIVDFMRSAQAAPWQPFIKALDATLAAWLAPQVAAIRAADPDRLITVGWNDPALAGLPANAVLDFMSMHRFPPNAPRWLTYHLAMASVLRSAFPGKPVLLTEFGYATSEVDPAQAAVCESATWLHALESGLAGAGKWMLWDLPPGPNPRERSFGLYTANDQPKPSAHGLHSLSNLLAPSTGPHGNLTLTANATGGVGYRFQASDARFCSGDGVAGDDLVRWQGYGLGQLFVHWITARLLRIRVTAPGQVRLDLGKVRTAPDAGPYALTADGAPLQHTREGAMLTFAIWPGQTVECQYEATITSEAIDAQIAILWPHDNLPVTQARRANITAYLTQANSRQCVPCDFDREVVLWQAQNNDPARPVAVGVRRFAEFDGRRLPVWDFNDIDISAAQDPKTKLCFSVRVADAPCRSNVWVNANDARTLMPQAFAAEAERPVSPETAPAEVDARIQILWPHGGVSTNLAQLANISVDLFLPGTRTRLAPTAAAIPWKPAVWLRRAIDNGAGERVSQGILRADPNGAAHWDFNDVDVSIARDPARKLHYWVEVDGVTTYSNFWTHGVDGRTYLPNPEPPLGNCP
jgi:hypothetical protein